MKLRRLQIGGTGKQQEAESEPTDNGHIHCETDKETSKHRCFYKDKSRSRHEMYGNLSGGYCRFCGITWGTYKHGKKQEVQG